MYTRILWVLFLPVKQLNTHEISTLVCFRSDLLLFVFLDRYFFRTNYHLLSLQFQRKSMKQITLFILLFLVFSCGEQTPENSVQKKFRKPFKTVVHKTMGIILTEELTVYNLNKDSLKTIGNLYGEIVQIDSISKNKYDLKNTDDRCNLYNFVKVRSKKINGWVYSPEVYEHIIAKVPYEYPKEDTTLIFADTRIKIIPAKNFNIGVYDETVEGLSFCSGNEKPVILYNSMYNKYEFIPISDETSKEIIYSSRYFTFDSNDGWHDELISSSFKDTILTLEIKREFQEGHAKLVIQITLDRNQSIGKIISYDHDPYSYD